MEWTSTRDPALRASFLEAVETNVPPGGGLYQPLLPPPFPDVERVLGLPTAERATEIVARLLAPELGREAIVPLVDEALDFARPLVEVEPDVAAFELHHGPTLSFKDVGVGFLAALLARGARAGSEAEPVRSRIRTVLTATSGDTGAAVAHAFHGRDRFRVAVLYPAGRISPLQERQIATLGGNVRAFAVAGSFDDCQAMVKSAFSDAELAREAGLVSANSIHVARLVAQIVYYFELAAAARREGSPLVVAVPSGNFGNLFAGLVARRLGAPIDRFVAATNANATVPEHLQSGTYRPRESVATLSNAMDVGAPGNWERALALHDGDLDALRAVLRWASVDDAGTRAELARLRAAGYAADPHGAVASAALRATLRPGERGVFLATAHPAKFEATLDPSVPLPPALASVAAKPLLAEALESDPAALVRALRAGRPHESADESEGASA